VDNNVVIYVSADVVTCGGDGKMVAHPGDESLDMSVTW